jgi:cytochrome c biogenesis protein CcmG/thiol:disulfide interchange protein DsbE
VKSSVTFVGIVVVLVTGLLFVGRKFTSPQAKVANAAGGDAQGFSGRQAPDFELKVVESNDKMKLSDLKGKAVVLNFWATWCEPCKVEMPWLVDLQKKYGSEGLQIVGVAMDDTDEKTISDFAHKMGVNYPILKGTEKVADLYGGIQGLPELFFIDRSGKILEHDLGLRGADVIEANIKKSLESSSNSTKAALAPTTKAASAQ